jgi:hypothetical protein
MIELMNSISTSIVRKLRELSKKVGEADLKMLLADLSNELGDAKLSAADLKVELASARERIAELERHASRSAQSEPVLHEGGYVFGDNSRHYCTGCFDTKGQKVLLTELPPDFRVFGKWSCPSCEKTFGPEA